MDKKRVLPMAYPEITSWNWVAGLLSILSNYDDTKGWIYSNYIMLVCRKENRTSSDKLFLDFLPFHPLVVCPFIKLENYNRKTILQYYETYNEFLINSINNNKYIYCTADQGFMFKKNKKFIHEMFIFGYSTENNNAYVADFTFRGKYSYEAIDIDLLTESIKLVTEEDDFINGVRLVQFNESTKYEFNLERVKKLFKLYLEPDYMISDINSKVVYGIDIYEMGDRQIDETYINRTPWDVRFYHNLYDHKIIMINRLKYMKKYGYANVPIEVIEEFVNLSQIVLRMRNLCIKLNIQNNWSKDKMIYLKEKLKMIKEKEIALLKELLRVMQ